MSTKKYAQATLRCLETNDLLTLTLENHDTFSGLVKIRLELDVHGMRS